MPAALRSIAVPFATTGGVLNFPAVGVQPNDHVYMLAVAYAQFADTLAPCAEWEDVPTEWRQVADVPIIESATIVGRFACFTTKATAGGVTFPSIPNPVSATSKIAFCTGVSVKDVGGEPGIDSVILGPFNTLSADTPPVTVVENDTIVPLVVVTVGHHDDPVVSPPYQFLGAQSTSLLHGVEIALYWTDPLDTSVPALPTAIEIPLSLVDGTSGWYVVAALPMVPITPPPSITLPEFRRLRLGTADDYKVFITGPDYETVIDGVGWTELDWNLVLDESSTANATVPDRYGGVRCVAHLGGLAPWRFGLRIERNDQEVWSGPVTNVQRLPNAIKVSASDIMSRFQKRLTIRSGTINFAEADAGVAFAAVLLAAQIAGEAWHLQPPEALVGQPITRSISALNFEMAMDVINDFAETAVDYWIKNNVLYVFQPGAGWMYWDGFETVALDGPYASSGEMVYGLFTETAFTEMPLWSINGWSQSNTAWITGPDAGEDGFRSFWTASFGESINVDGVLDHVESGSIYQPNDEEIISDVLMQKFADSIIALRGVSPAIIEGGALAEVAPIDMENLRPGSIWQCDIYDAGYGQLLQRSRLKRVEVTVTKDQDGRVVELIRPTLFPVGYEEL